MNNNPEEPPRRYSPRSLLELLNGPRRFRLALYLGAAIIALLLIFAVTMPVTSNPIVCGFCHNMTQEINAWKKSSHARITCYACHGEPGLVPILKEYIVGGATGFIKQVTGNYEKPIGANSEPSRESSRESCLRCHSPATRKFTVTKGLTMDSTAPVKHLAAGVYCPVCHDRVAHKAVDEVSLASSSGHRYIDGLDMFKDCLRCHHAKQAYKAPNGHKAPTKCSTCHNSEWKLKPDSHDDPAVWKDQGLHGRTARKDINYCMNCHAGRAETGVKECFECHGVSMPHPSNWRKIHFKVAAQIGWERCAVCHTSAGQFSCNACHHRQFGAPEPWLIDRLGQSQHPAVVRRESVTKCFTCHKPQFCPRCHIGGLDDHEKYRQVYMLRENQ